MQPDTTTALMRSLLFVPGDSEKKLARSATVLADALILDLEDSVLPARKAAARTLVAEFLIARAAAPQLWVRINPFGTAECDADLECVMVGRPDVIVLPKARSAADVIDLGRRLAVLEQRLAIAPGATRILPITTETPAALFAHEGYLQCGRRLAALTWGAEDLSAALGATANRGPTGCWLPPYELARTLCILTAAGASVPAIDTVFTDLEDAVGLEREASAARRDGFAGKLAVHPGQVPVLNRIFQPTVEEIATAQRIVAAFAASTAGVVALDGHMLDRPHLLRANRALRIAAMVMEAGRR